MSAPWSPSSIALATDLYELTMSAAYLELGMTGTATFSLFVRKLPAARRWLVAAGLSEAISRLTRFAFDERAAELAIATGRIAPAVARRLRDVRFTGEVWAMPEGRVFFAGEPVLEVTAPIVEAQLVETIVLNAIHYDTIVATKAARTVAAARGRTVVDFGLRRAPGIEAGLAAARAAWIVGFGGTSNVLATERYGIPPSGTVAHSFVEANETELAAFRAWARAGTGPVTLLVDTYDTRAGVEHAIAVAREIRDSGREVGAIRIDSGDLRAHAEAARRKLDEAGLGGVKIFASGGLDEYSIDALADAPIDGFAVGTRLAMSADAPVLDLAYKIVEYAGRPCLKTSEGKETMAFPKQVYRRHDTEEQFCEDRIALRDEPAPGADWEPLLERVVHRGERTPEPSLSHLRGRHAEEIGRMPARLIRDLTCSCGSGKKAETRDEFRYPVRCSDALLVRQADAVAARRRSESA
jgi:nicotinate phosphoribosyltransferase